MEPSAIGRGHSPRPCAGPELIAVAANAPAQEGQPPRAAPKRWRRDPRQPSRPAAAPSPAAPGVGMAVKSFLRMRTRAEHSRDEADDDRHQDLVQGDGEAAAYDVGEQAALLRRRGGEQPAIAAVAQCRGDADGNELECKVRYDECREQDRPDPAAVASEDGTTRPPRMRPDPARRRPNTRGRAGPGRPARRRGGGRRPRASHPADVTVRAVPAQVTGDAVSLAWPSR